MFIICEAIYVSVHVCVYFRRLVGRCGRLSCQLRSPTKTLVGSCAQYRPTPHSLGLRFAVALSKLILEYQISAAICNGKIFNGVMFYHFCRDIAT